MASDIGFPDDFEPTPELRAATLKMLQAVETWQKAVTGSGDESMWYPRIDAVRKKAKNFYEIVSDDQLFLGKSQAPLYNDLVKAYLDLQDDIQFSKSTLPRPDLIDQAADFVTSLKDFPSDVIEGFGDILKKSTAAVTDAFTGSATEIVKKLWPWALGLVVVIVAVEFGPTIAKRMK